MLYNIHLMPKKAGKKRETTTKIDEIYKKQKVKLQV